MKYLSTRKGKQDQEVHSFEGNKDEWKLVYDLLTNAYMAIPGRVIGLSPVKQRIANMRKEIYKNLFS